MYSGRIVKAMSGFYYVKPDGDTEIPEGVFNNPAGFQCRAKGIFRKKKITPLVGDRVRFELTETEDVEGNIMEILPRKNALIRPRVANLDQALVIFALHMPEPALPLLDRFLIEMQRNDIGVILVFNKEDLSIEEEALRYRDIYRDAGVRIHFTSTVDGTGIEELKGMLKNTLTAVAGPSGAGKSSIINSVSGKELLVTGELSKKINRGKQTTRHTELIEIGKDSYIIDTPGFSSLELSGIRREELSGFFPEIRKYGNECYYKDCSHINEPDCNVISRVNTGEIPRERYESYVSLYKEL